MNGVQVLVLGSGIGGILAAAAVTEYADTVTIVERDHLPDQPRDRKGIPQGRHVHGLLSTGVLAIDDLLPGTLAELISAGANRIPMSDALVYGPHGWIQKCAVPHFIVGASRALVEYTLRTRLLHHHGHHTVRILQRTEVMGLLGDAHRVRGVRVRDRDGDGGRHHELTADLIVDTTGRRSKTPQWLTEFGLPAVHSTVVDCGLAYASTTVHTSTPDRMVACVNLMPDSRAGTPGTGGFLLRVEDQHWMMALSGTRGNHPPLSEAPFRRFAGGLRHPLLSDLLSHVDPITRIHGYRDTANRRHHYERCPSWPAGLLVLGDAVTTFNPVYGQGMTVAALSALALRGALRRHIGREPDHFAVQKRICRTATVPWWMCTTEDIRYPQATGPTPTWAVRVAQHLADRLRAAATRDPAAARLFYDLASLSITPSGLLTPRALTAIARRPHHPPPSPSAA